MTSDPHASGGPALVGDLDSLPADAELARGLVAAHRRAALSTLTPDGAPFGSVVSYLADDTGSPVVCISSMAEHTVNLHCSPRASVLVTEPVPDGADPLAYSRVTLLGVMLPFEVTTEMRSAFLSAHPGAGVYVDFPDFSWWRLEVTSARYVGGFGHMSWVTGDVYAAADPDPISPQYRPIAEHLDDDHADTLLDYAQVLVGIPDAVAATTAGVDRGGLTLYVTTSGGSCMARVAFAQPASTADEVRVATIELARLARERRARSTNSTMGS